MCVVPVVTEHLAGLGVDDVDDDAAVAPAPLEQVAVLVALPRDQGLVEEGPGELLLAVDLQGSPRAHAHVLAAEVVVLRVGVVRPGVVVRMIVVVIVRCNTVLN